MSRPLLALLAVVALVIVGYASPGFSDGGDAPSAGFVVPIDETVTNPDGSTLRLHGSLNADIAISEPPPPPAPEPPPPPAVADYWVAPSGDDSSPGTLEQPFRTIQRAANAVVAGDTVVVRDGTYTDTTTDTCGYPTVVCLHRGGTAAAHVTFRAEHRWGAIVDGQNARPNGFTWSAGAGYVDVDGFLVKSLRTSGGSVSAYELFNGGVGSRILNCRTEDIGRSVTSTTNGQVGVFTTANDVTVEGCYFRDIGRLNNDQQHDHGIYLNDGDNVTIRGNYFEDFLRGWAVQLYPGSEAGTVIEDNSFVGGFPNRQNTHIIIGAALTGRMSGNTFWSSGPSKTMVYYKGQLALSLDNNVSTGDAWTDRGTPAGFIMGPGNVLDAQIPKPPPPG